MAGSVLLRAANLKRPTPRRALNESRLAGIALICGAAIHFAFLDTSVKYLATVAHVPLLQIVWLRFAMNAFFITALMGRKVAVLSLKSRKLGLQCLRSFFLLATTAFNFFALQFLQLDQTSTIFFLSPLIIAALAGPILNEWVGWHRLIVICIGFSGVIFITRPFFGGIHWAVSFSFLSTLGYALYSLLTRYLARFDKPSTTVVHTPLAGTILLAPFAISAWQTPQSTGYLILLLLTGILGGAGHWLLVLAHERAPAPVLAPFTYVNVVFMISLGYIVFSDVPSWWTFAGAAIIVSSGAYIVFRERQMVCVD